MTIHQILACTNSRGMIEIWSVRWPYRFEVATPAWAKFQLFQILTNAS
jgi:hypothetical protein